MIEFIMYVFIDTQERYDAMRLFFLSLITLASSMFFPFLYGAVPMPQMPAMPVAAPANPMPLPPPPAPLATPPVANMAPAPAPALASEAVKDQNAPITPEVLQFATEKITDLLIKLAAMSKYTKISTVKELLAKVIPLLKELEAKVGGSSEQKTATALLSPALGGGMPQAIPPAPAPVAPAPQAAPLVPPAPPAPVQPAAPAPMVMPQGQPSVAPPPIQFPPVKAA